MPRHAGANHVTLIEAQANFAAIGAKAYNHDRHVRATSANDARDPLWRPLDPTLDDFERPIAGVDYGASYPPDRTELYYWRANYWRRSPRQ